MLNFREAIPSDIPQLLLLEQCLVDAERPFNTAIKPGNPTYYDIEDLVSNDNACLLVVEESSKIIGTGYAQIRKSKDSLQHEFHAYLGFMYVDPEQRGKGINQELMARLISWSKNKGIHDLYLDVYSQNEAAIKAYEKVGFEPCLLEMKLKAT